MAFLLVEQIVVIRVHIAADATRSDVNRSRIGLGVASPCLLAKLKVGKNTKKWQ